MSWQVSCDAAGQIERLRGNLDDALDQESWMAALIILGNLTAYVDECAAQAFEDADQDRIAQSYGG